MQDDINKLKKIIYNKLTTLQNYSIIHEFVEKNSIPKTVNQNGTFINLSLLIKSKPLQKSCGDIDCICDCE